MRKMGLAASAVVAVVFGAADVQAKDLVIGISHQSLAFPYAVGLAKGVDKAAAELGVKTIHLDSNGDLLTQANQIDKLIAQGVAGVIIDPADSIAAQDWADRAKAAGIPMVSMGVFVGDPAEHQPPWVYPSLLALADRSDPEQAYRIGKAIVADHPDGGKIAIIEGLPGFAAVKWRDLGLQKAIAESGKPFQIVFQQPANWNPEKAHQLCQDALQANPEISILFVHDQAMAQGCLPAVKAANSKARIYTFDFSKSIKDTIVDGAPILTTCSEPETSGYQAMTTLVQYVRTGKPVADPFLTYKWSLISKDNIDACPVQY